MKKQKKRAARKRMEKRRERRRKRHQPAVVPPGTAPEQHGVLRTWVSDPLAMAVSGRILVFTQVRTRSSTWLVVTRASLLGGGYLETFDVRMGNERLSEGTTHALLADMARPWGASMRPAPVPLASRLVWGAMAYSMSRGVIASPEDDAMPALGYLPPPPGNPAAWCVDFVRRFEDDQIAIADVVADQLREVRESGEDHDEYLPPAPRFWIEIHLDTETPLSTWAEIDRHPAEFSYVETRHQRGIYRWRSRSASSRLLEPEMMPSHGVVGLSSSGRIDAMALDVACATAIVMRLQELAPSLRLRSCHWLAEDLVEEKRALDEVGPLVQAVWPPVPRQALR